jgi:hypothetical protein
MNRIGISRSSHNNLEMNPNSLTPQSVIERRREKRDNVVTTDVASISVDDTVLSV